MKKVLFVFAAALMAITACTKSELPVVVEEGATDASFSINLANSLATKAIADGTTAEDLTFVVLDKDGVELAGLRQDVKLSGLKATVSTNLIVGQKYTFVFWACNAASGIYDVTDITAVKADYNKVKAGNDESRDAFYAVIKDVVMSEGYSQNVTLKRPFAQLNLVSTDKAACEALGVAYTPSKSIVTVTGVANELNLLDGTVTGDETITFDAAGIINETIKIAGVDYAADQNNYLSMNYLLVGADKGLTDVSLSVLNASDAEIAARTYTKIPVQRNYRTNIYGSLLTTAANFNVDVNPEFDGDEDIEVIVPDAVIKTADDFKDLIENKLAKGGYFRIDADIDMTGVDFDNSVNPMNSFTIDGTGHTVTGLQKAMIEGVSQGNAEYVFKDITVKDSQIAMTSGGAAAFIGWIETKPFVTFENCNVEGGKISTTGSYAAAFYGYAAGYNVLNNGPVFTDITIKNCTVSGVEIEANKSVGAICGHATGNAWTKVTIDGCTVENNTLTTKQNTHVYVGAILGTVGAGQTNQGKDGGVWISNCTVEGNTVAWNGGTDPAQRWYGRQGTPGGVLYIDGVCPYLVKNADDSYTIENGHQLAYLASEGFNMGVSSIVLNFPENATIDMTGISYGHGDNTTNIPAKVVINGNGATIENLEVSGRQATLIPNTAAGMEVKDITIKNSTFTGKGEDVWNDCAAAFGSFCDGAGGNAVSFSNVTIDGVTVSNSKYAAGFVAYCSGNVSSYTNCVVKNCNISSKYTEDGGASYKGHCGGFIGLCGGGTITGCSVENTVFDVKGPRCGIFVGTSNGAAITGTASFKNVTGLTDYVGNVAPANFQVVVTAE